MKLRILHIRFEQNVAKLFLYFGQTELCKQGKQHQLNGFQFHFHLRLRLRLN